MTWSATEILLILTNLGTLIRWWFDRRDAQSALKTGKDKADEAVATLTKALEAKNEEMDEDKAEWQEERQRLLEAGSQAQARIAHLESLVYGRNGSL